METMLTHAGKASSALVRSRVIQGACVAALVLSACAGGGDGETEASGDPDAEAQSDCVVTIGATLPLSGGQAEIGQWMNDGATLGMEEVNENELLGEGVSLELEVEDNEGQDEVGVTSVQTFADMELPTVLTSYTGLTLAAVPTAESEEIVLLNGGGSGNELAGASEYLFNVFPVVRDEHAALTEHLMNEGYETAAILHVENEFGNSYRDDFTQTYPGEITEVQSFQAGASDVRSQLQVIASTEPEVLYISTGGGSDSVTILTQAAEVGIDAPVAGIANMVTPEVLELAEANGTIHTTYELDVPEFESRYEERFGYAPTIFSTNYYDGIMAFATAYQAVADGASDGSSDCEIEGSAMRDALETAEAIPGASGEFAFTDEQVVSRPIAIAVVSDGVSEIVGTAGAED